MKNSFTLKIFVALFMILGTLTTNAQIIWEEDFANGVDQWSLIDNSINQSGDVWIYSTDGPQGNYSIGPIASTSADNGWALFDSDLLCSGSQDAWMVSDTIDLTAEDNVILFFEQFYAAFFSQTFVQVSNDGGVTWTEFEVNGSFAVNDISDNPGVIEIDITAVAANQEFVQIAFQYLSDDVANEPLSGCGFSWQIDNITLEQTGTPPPPVDDSIIWGGPGNDDSEFNNGLGNWTTVGLSNMDAIWKWDAEGDASEGAFWGNLSPIISPSVANGAAVFDSDFYDNGGDPDMQGMGPVPGPHTAELISPIIDLTDETAVAIEFNQFHRNFQATCSVAWSNDGGATWSDPIEINESVPVNEATARDDVQFIRLFGAGGTDQFQVKFIWDGNYYFWIVDDVKIVRRDSYDLLMDIFSGAPNFVTPSSQVDSIFFGAVASNPGNAEQTDVRVSATVDGPGGTWSTQETIATQISGQSDTVFMAEGYEIPASVGSYTITYETQSDSTDALPGDNIGSVGFQVSGDLYSKDDDNIPSATQPAGASDVWQIGSYYVVQNEGYQANEAIFSVASNGNVHQGQSVNVFLYQVTEDDDPSTFDDNDVTIVGLGFYNFTNEANFTVVSTPLEDFDTGEDGVPLVEGGEYFLMVEYQPDMFAPFSENPYYTGVFGDIGTVIRDDVADWFLAGFGPGTTVQARLRIGEIETNSTTDLTSTGAVIATFPNPSDNYMKLTVELPEVASEMNVRIVDITGKMLEERNFDNFQNSEMSFDVATYSNGIYMVQVTTEEGTTTRKFVVQH
ncbi:MAG: T9SS type A sorting domain-containing protein [Saprospiraceae bacterium]|jgi:hypothetical protein|nr:T9SS type A sorting domain-containing protein [Saprospiraceae bacterium]